jgi:solute carrier family 50 protein (sugar transporter)
MVYEALGWVATAVTIGLFVSNFQPIATVRSHKTTAGQSPNSLYGMFFNCFWWSAYGLLLGNGSVMACNSVGLAVASYGLYVFISNGETTVVSHAISRNTGWIVGGSAALAALLWVALDPSNTLYWYGMLASGGSVLLFAAPLSNLGKIVQLQDASELSPLVVAFSLGCTSLWTLYAVLLDNLFMLVPNALGLLLSIVQLVLMLKFHRPKGVAGIPTSPRPPSPP